MKKISVKNPFKNRLAVSRGTKYAIDEVKSTTAVGLAVSLIALVGLNIADSLMFIEDDDEVVYIEGADCIDPSDEETEEG